MRIALWATILLGCVVGMGAQSPTPALVEGEPFHVLADPSATGTVESYRLILNGTEAQIRPTTLPIDFFVPNGLPVGTHTAAVAAANTSGATLSTNTVTFPVLAAAPPPQQATIFAMNYSAAAAPLGGWATNADIDGNAGRRFTIAHAPGAGPSGQDAYLMTQLSATSLSSCGGQYNWGWRGDVEPTNPPRGEPRYYRWRMKFSPETNFRGAAWGGSCGLTGQQNKILLVSFNGGRFIMTTRASANNGFIYTLGIGGGANEIESPSYPVGVWKDVQVELRSGSGNGGYKLWVDNNDQNNPTVQIGGLTIGENDWNKAWFGGFMNDGMQTTGVYQWWHTDLQVGRTFDPAWHGGSSPPPPQPACSDGQDNDQDGLTDFPNDPGCASATDPDETNAAPPPTGSTPFSGQPISLPGTIQAEEFDNGGPTVAYVDTGAGNNGGAFRQTDVDLEATTDTGGGFNVGWTAAPEWLLYTVDVPTAGVYTLELRVASAVAGGTIRVEVGGQDVTGPIAFPNTGGWQTWQTLTKTGVNLAAGVQPLRLVFATNNPGGYLGNVNWLKVVTPSQPPPTASCADGLDNDGDGLIDLADPGCSSPSDTDEFNAPPPDPCITDPLRITQIAWPSDNTGRRSLTFSVGTKRWTQFDFVWPGRLTVTDTRGCVATVTR